MEQSIFLRDFIRPQVAGPLLPIDMKPDTTLHNTTKSLRRSCHNVVEWSTRIGDCWVSAFLCPYGFYACNFGQASTDRSFPKILSSSNVKFSFSLTTLAMLSIRARKSSLTCLTSKALSIFYSPQSPAGQNILLHFMSALTTRASEAISSVSEAIRAQEKHQDTIEGSKRAQFDVDASLQEFHAWQATCLEGRPQVASHAETFWGLDGWAEIRPLVDNVVNLCEDILEFLSKSRPKHKHKIWAKVAAIHTLRSTGGSQSTELQTLTAKLHNAVNELKRYSKMVSYFRCGVTLQVLHMPWKERLLASALRSRAASVQLYNIYATSNRDCSLVMDLFYSDADIKNSADLLHKRIPPFMRLSYHLLAQRTSSTVKFQQRTIEHRQEVDLFHTQTSYMSQISTSEADLFSLSSKTTIIRVPARGSFTSSYLFIPKKSTTRGTIKHRSEKLATMLENTLVMSDPTTKKEAREYKAMKIELAYKIVESGLFLLGTPWFAALFSKNALVFRGAEGRQSGLALQVSPRDLTTLLEGDPDALSETSHLFRVGVLLLELALDRTFPRPVEAKGQFAKEAAGLLPEVERAMGAHYQTATAFCLKYSEKTDGFNGWEKYGGAGFKKWEGYLGGLLEVYYREVFLR